MSKWLTVICILAVAVVLCAPAFAEVQNVKVSGDMTVRALYRGDYADSTAATQQFLMESVGLNVDADLTDNVSTSVRLVNQRDLIGIATTATSNVYTVDVDTAYVTLKEMVYAPLTLTIGRQDLWFGRGLIIGALLPTPDATQSLKGDYNASITAKEYTETTAFDALKATIDLAPWKLDLLYSKISNAAVAVHDDVDLYGANLGYKFDVYNGEAEAYYFGKFSAAKITSVAGENTVNTYGLRGSLEPITNLTIGAEGAWQAGKFSDNNASGRSREAYAVDAFGKYKFANVMMKPTLGVEWLMLSGDPDSNDSTGTNKYKGWDAMYSGKFDTAIRSFQNYLYNTTARETVATATWNQDSGMSNQNSLLVKGSIKPLEDVTLEGTYAHFWMNKKLNQANLGTFNSSKDIGDELDLLLTYDYTEDVSFGLLAGWFFPGDMFPATMNETASDIVGTMKVVF